MQVLSQAKAKQIRSLQQKKVRQSEGFFVVEGSKSVLETLQSHWKVEYLVGTSRFFDSIRKWEFAQLPEIFETNVETLAQISHFQSNNAVLAVVRQEAPLLKPQSTEQLWLALDSISDPGNLGSIIRMADWFGLPEVICLGDCVEWFNPKVIAGTMGSFLRVKPVTLKYEDLRAVGRTIIAADMGGESVFRHAFPDKCVLVIGNESHGISDAIKKLPHQTLAIPRFGQAESLNAAMATGIFLSHWRSKI